MPLPTFPSEQEDFTDPKTGVTVTRWTNYLGHSSHLYFTNPGWWDDGHRMVITSDRMGKHNLFSLEFATGEITQITDRDDLGFHSFLSSFLNPTRPENIAWLDGTLTATDLTTGEMRPLFTRPHGWTNTNPTVTADGKYALSAIAEKVSFAKSMRNNYTGFRDTFEARPLTRIIRIALDTGEMDVAHEENRYITHINASPKHPHLMTYCHEGPWELVEQRMWGLDLGTGDRWPIRPQQPGDAVGHEYWFADGERLGYHGYIARDNGHTDKVYGSIRYDSTDLIEVPFPDASHHFHSNDLNLIVGDGEEFGPRKILLWRYLPDENRFDGPRVVCDHGSSRHIQKLHVHPRLTPDATTVVFTSDAAGYGNVYTAEIPAFESLPLLEK